MEKKPDRCPCGAIILADTEDWDIPLCYECYMAAEELGVKKELETEIQKHKDVHKDGEEC